MHKYLYLVILVFSNTGIFSQNLQWAKSIGGNSDSEGRSVAVDRWGNVYTTGRFQDTIDLDPGNGIANFKSAGSYDVFISKLDASGNFIWGKSIGGPNTDYGLSIAVDANGNVYVSGDFGFTADFDPGAATYNLTSATFNSFFILKLDFAGNFAWAKSLSATSTNYLNSEGWHIAVDGQGNVYTTGCFNGAGDFDPGAGISILSSQGKNDIFILKLDTSGNFVWAKSMGGTSNDEGRGITVDESGNVYTTGFFGGLADFDPGPQNYKIGSLGGSDIFISKLDASGKFVWAKSFRGIFSDEAGYSIAVDRLGNVYTTGFFGKTADFDPGDGTYNLLAEGYSDIFISKLDASGKFVWAKAIGGNSPYADIGNSICLDAANNVYTTGYFFRTADFDPGTGIFKMKSAGGPDVPDIFISKLNASGNFVWAKRIGSTSWDNGWSIAADTIGNVYAAGMFGGTVDFDPGTGIYNLTSKSSYDVFVLKIGARTTGTTTANGNWDDPNIWAGKAVPPAGNNVVIKSKVIANVNTTCKSLIVQSPGSLTIKAGVKINILP